MNTSLAAAKRLAFASATAALASFGFSPAAQALGLGKINVLSGLNQPLRAVVPLLLEEDESPDQITLAIARDDEANKFGALPNLLGQELSVVISLQGNRTEALITTEFPVKEPHVDVVLHAQMGDTKHLRIYPVLLDLPIGYFEPEIDDSYLEANINARTNWDGKPSDHQRDQMNTPAEVTSLKVDGNTIEPIQVGNAPTTVDSEEAFAKTTTYIAANEDDVVREREIADNEISAIQLTAGISNVGVALEDAVEEAVADLSVGEVDTTVDDTLSVETNIAAVDATADTGNVDGLPVKIDSAVDTSDFADMEVDDTAGAVLPSAPTAQREDASVETTVRVYPQVKPAIPVALSEPAAAMPEQLEDERATAAKIDLADWAGTDAKLPLPEEVLLAEVPDDIGATITDTTVPRSEALRVNQQRRAPYN